MIDATNWQRPPLDEIVRLLKSTGCSKAELARRIGYSQRSIEKWANGQNVMSFCAWFTVMAVAKENADEILERDV